MRSTGLPAAYDDILNTTGAIFFTAACLAWAPGAGLYNPIVVLIVYIIVKMIIGVGSDMVSFDVEYEMNSPSFVVTLRLAVAHNDSSRIVSNSLSQEDPFGHDESDLPLEKFCQEIEKQITAVDERAKLITYDLARGPAAHNPAQWRRSSYSTSTLRTSSSSSDQGSLATSEGDDIESGRMPSETDRLIS